MFQFLQGFCGMTVVKHDRLLIYGNPDLGILQYKDKFYSFTSRQAAEEFAQDPDM